MLYRFNPCLRAPWTELGTKCLCQHGQGPADRPQALRKSGDYYEQTLKSKAVLLYGISVYFLQNGTNNIKKTILCHYVPSCFVFFVLPLTGFESVQKHLLSPTSKAAPAQPKRLTHGLLDSYSNKLLLDGRSAAAERCLAKPGPFIGKQLQIIGKNSAIHGKTWENKSAIHQNQCKPHGCC